MKRLVLTLLILVAAANMPVCADDLQLPPINIKKGKGDEGNQGHRAPAILPVEILYNTETAILRITSWGEIEAEVYLLDAAGEMENYSPMLNCELVVPSSGLHTILIQGEDWYAITDFEN